MIDGRGGGGTSGCGEASILQKTISAGIQDRSRYNVFIVPAIMSSCGERFAREAQAKEGEEGGKGYVTDAIAIDSFEFKASPAPETPSTWTDDFRSFGLSKEMASNHHHHHHHQHQVDFPTSFETAFNWKGGSVIEPHRELTWVNEFKEPGNCTSVTWATEFINTTSLGSNIAPVSDWAAEFNSTLAEKGDGGQEAVGEEDTVSDAAELGATAEEILRNLTIDDDPKLANSRFVAYLRELAGSYDNSDSLISNGPRSSNDNNNPEEDQMLLKNIMADSSGFENWRASYLQKISHLSNDSEWVRMEKGWNEYQGTGHGYRDFAMREFKNYHFSIPTAANRYREGLNREAGAELALAEGNLKTAILILEAEVYENPNNSAAWRRLGELQQANEMDTQAIAAFIRATSLDPDNASSWLDLAASCINESCIPDALDALRHLLPPSALKPGQSASKTRQWEGNLARSDLRLYCSAFDQAAKGDPSGQHYIIAASILHNVAGNHDRAIDLLRPLVDGAAMVAESMTSKWCVMNRLGASLANAKRYEEALQIYQLILSNGVNYPRVHYNQGISLMCTGQYDEAARSFVRAIESQIPVDVITDIKEELVANYTAPWEALGVTFSLAGRENWARCDSSRLAEIKKYLGM